MAIDHEKVSQLLRETREAYQNARVATFLPEIQEHTVLARDTAKRLATELAKMVDDMGLKPTEPMVCGLPADWRCPECRVAPLGATVESYGAVVCANGHYSS